MTLDLTLDDIDTLLTSLSYSKRGMQDAPDTPAGVRQANLARLEEVSEKLRLARGADVTI